MRHFFGKKKKDPPVTGATHHDFTTPKKPGTVPSGKEVNIPQGTISTASLSTTATTPGARSTLQVTPPSAQSLRSTSSSSSSVSPGPLSAQKAAALKRQETSSAFKTAKDLRHKKDLTIDHFHVGKTLGMGAFGRVRFVQLKGGDPDTDIYAMKTLKKASIIGQNQVYFNQRFSCVTGCKLVVEQLLSERKILMDLSHPFIVNLLGCFDDQRYLYLALEYVCGGDFFSYIHKHGQMESPRARFYAANIASIFEYLHEKDVIYRDLKPENMLLSRDGYIKLTDFGLAKLVTSRTKSFVGTPEYIAPEVLLNQGHGKAVDWWTLGILIYEMFTGAPPITADDFQNDDQMILYQKILCCKIRFPRYMHKDARELVKKLLTVDLKRRYGGSVFGVEYIKNCDWFRKIDWELLVRKEIKPPFIPVIKDAKDTSNFDEECPDSDTLAPLVKPAKDPFVGVWRGTT